MSTDAADGTWSLQLTKTVGAGTIFANTTGGTGGIAAAAEKSYTAGASFRAATTGRGCQVRMVFSDVAGADISDAIGGSVTDQVGNYNVTPTVTATSPAGTRYITIELRVNGAALSEVHRVDKIFLRCDGVTVFEAGIGPAVAYPRFDGHTNNWPTQWVKDAVEYAEAQLTATDRFKRLGRPGELRSLLEEEVLRDATVASAYFPLSEPDGSTSAASITKQIQDTATIRQVGSGGDLEFGAGTGPGTDGLSAPMFTPATATAGKYLLAQLATPVGGSSNAITLEAWFATEGAPTSRAIAILETAAGSRVELVIDASGNLQGSTVLGSDGATYLLTTSAATVNDGHTHHAVLTLSYSAGTVTGRLYLDGPQVDTDTYSSSGLGQCFTLRLGGRKASNLFAGTISHVAAHSAVLSAARILDHYNAGANGLAGERTDQRLARLADYIAIPTADRNFDVGDGTMGAQSTSGQEPIEAFREVGAVEDGQLFVAGDGDLTFHKRSRRYNVTPAVTLTGSQIMGDLVFPGEDTDLVNDFTVTRPGGSPARYIDQDSIDEFGLYRDSKEIPAATDAATFSA
ncbi:MAG TPA: LamG domain-containing protein, partial [Acidimicrobiales bacterium]